MSIIGLGDMGAVVRQGICRYGLPGMWLRPARKPRPAREELDPYHIKIMDSGMDVSRISDLIIYSVEADKMLQVVAECGSSTKYGAIVAGQTSVKTPEIETASRNTCLPMRRSLPFMVCTGRGFKPKGQTLILIRHRADDEAYQRMLDLFTAIGSEIVEMADYHEHDKIVADTQAVTHVGFESMGTA